MRKILVLTGVLSCAVLVLGCPKKKDGDGDGGADASAEAEAAPVVTEAADAAPAPAPVTAKNTADVARFPAETAVSDDDLKLASTAPARTSPKTGTVVATLKPGTDVTKIAEYQNSILVTFADPKDASATLMGWIGKEAFVHSVVKVVKVDGGAAVDAGGGGGTKTLTCPLGMAAIVLTKDPVCRKKCTKDADCKGAVAGSCANATTAAGGVARVCTVE